MLLRIFLTLFILLHGFIHILGFMKAFDLAKIEQLSSPISRQAGVFWLLSALGFMLSALLVAMGKNGWWFFVIPIILMSQILIILSWPDAKFGTIPNLMILIVGIVCCIKY